MPYEEEMGYPRLCRAELGPWDSNLTSFSFVTDSYFSSRLRHSNSHFSAFMASSCRWP